MKFPLLWGKNNAGKDGFVMSHIKSVIYDWESKKTLADKLDEIDESNAKLKSVAFSGSYTDLSNKPTIPPAVAVKGNAESTYRTGNVNLTPANIGLGNVPNVSTNNQTPTFSQASNRANIASGETLSVIFGKIMKIYADLKSVAFSGSYTDLSNKPTIPPAVAVKGNAESTYRTGNVNLTPANIGAQAAITGGATTITGSNLTANRSLISDGNGKVAVSSVTSTQLGYLSGATSNVQTQINKLNSEKVAKSENPLFFQGTITGNLNRLDISPGYYDIGAVGTISNAPESGTCYCLFIQLGDNYKTQIIFDGGGPHTRSHIGSPAAWGAWTTNVLQN